MAKTIKKLKRTPCKKEVASLLRGHLIKINKEIKKVEEAERKPNEYLIALLGLKGQRKQIQLLLGEHWTQKSKYKDKGSKGNKEV